MVNRQAIIDTNSLEGCDVSLIDVVEKNRRNRQHFAGNGRHHGNHDERKHDEVASVTKQLLWRHNWYQTCQTVNAKHIIYLQTLSKNSALVPIYEGNSGIHGWTVLI